MYLRAISSAILLCLINVNCVAGFHKDDIRPFLVGGQQVGLIKADVYKQLLKFPEVFCIRDCQYTKQVNINQ